MILAMTFLTPLLLLALPLGAIPFLLHLLSSVRAKETPFPTLRLLRITMEKTSRRRRIQQWLLLLVRSALLVLLVVTVAEPVSRAAGGWLAGRSGSAVIILDNSMSMSATVDGQTRLAAAKAQAGDLLGAEERPSQAALLTTNGGKVSTGLANRLDSLRNALTGAPAGLGRAPIAQRVASATEMLADPSLPRKAVYIFSDLQKTSFDELMALRPWEAAKNVDVFVVNVGGRQVNNVGIADLQIAGLRVAGQVLLFEATLVNSSPSDKTVDVALSIPSAGSPATVTKTRVGLSAAGTLRATAVVRLPHRVAAGEMSGAMMIGQVDDLAADNARYFILAIAERLNALIVEGPPVAGGTTGSSAMLKLALEPYEDTSAPWSIRARTVAADKFTATDLAGCTAAFFCNVPTWTVQQARVLEQFVRAGGTATFFLGPDVRPEDYNRRLVEEVPSEGGLLPMFLAEPVGQIGPESPAVAVDFVDREHAYLKGLYEKTEDYLGVLVQRHFRTAPGALPPRVLMRLAGGAALLAAKPFGAGSVVLCTTSAEPTWSNLPASPLFLPLVSRIALLAPRQQEQDDTYLTGSSVTICPTLRGRLAQGTQPATTLGRLPAGTVVTVDIPASPGRSAESITLPLTAGPDGPTAILEDTDVAGLYRWQLSSPLGAAPRLGGSFAVNPNGQECDLAGVSPADVKRALERAGFRQVQVGASVAEVRALADRASQGKNWWDILAAATIALLLAETLVANRIRYRQGAADGQLPLADLPEAAATD
jgi:hypothetical protein